MDTPVELNVCLTLFNEGPLSNPTIYRQLVGNLVYLIVTYPDISYVVHQVSQFMATPCSTHYNVILLILSYLKGIFFHGLHFYAQFLLVLRAYSDADWTRNPIDLPSSTGYCFLIGTSLISWRNKKQSIVVHSNTEVEYCALAYTTSELFWCCWLLKDLGKFTSSATPIQLLSLQSVLCYRQIRQSPIAPKQKKASKF